MEIPEEKYENKNISVVDKNTEDPGVNINNAMCVNPPEHTSTNNNNTPKVDTFNESDAKYENNENKDVI